jgi:hypothetical protein
MLIILSHLKVSIEGTN